MKTPTATPAATVTGRKSRVLLVDDHAENLRMLGHILSSGYDIRIARSGEQALALVAREFPDLILLDIMMSGMSGFDVLERLKSNPKTRHIPVIFITGLIGENEEEKGFLLGAADYIRKPFRASIVKVRVDTQLRAKATADFVRDRAEQMVGDITRRTREVLVGQGVALMTMAALTEARDGHGGYHLARTQNYVRILASMLKIHPRHRDEFDDNAIDMLYKSAPLHDLGMIAVPNEILAKPGPLDDAEREIVRRHPEFGFQALLRQEEMSGGEREILAYAKQIIYSHHEKWNGSGYPQGLAGEAIPIAARLMALADAYDALTGGRVYRAAVGHEEAGKIIVASSGSHFDPDVVAAFVAREREFAEVAQRFADPPQP
ncbi:MAG: response regulator [Azoarcus sp.]|jgi:putative two-component system response regulator|nr:response regulator [Azoarcus sp.]